MGRHSSMEDRFWQTVVYLAAEDEIVVGYFRRLAVSPKNVIVEEFDDVSAHITGTYALPVDLRQEALNIAKENVMEEMYGRKA